MPRTYLTLLPLPVLAAIVAVAACSRPRSDDPVAHLIPAASPLLAPPSSAPPSPTQAAVAAAPSTTSTPDDDAPTPAELKAFERPVLK